jgi:hypothetical protein
VQSSHEARESLQGKANGKWTLPITFSAWACGRAGQTWRREESPFCSQRFRAGSAATNNCCRDSTDVLGINGGNTTEAHGSEDWIGTTLGYLGTALLKAIEIHEFEKRIAALEEGDKE